MCSKTGRCTKPSGMGSSQRNISTHFLQNREMHKAFWDGLLTEKHFNSFLVSSGRTAADDDSDPDISSAAAELLFVRFLQGKEMPVELASEMRETFNQIVNQKLEILFGAIKEATGMCLHFLHYNRRSDEEAKCAHWSSVCPKLCLI